MIMTFSFNKLFPRIPPLPPKTQFIKIQFVNQGLDLLNISNIFRDHRVTSKIPQYFENLDPPLICYQYKSPIRNIIFNYNQDKKEEIWLSPMTKAPTPTEMSKGQWQHKQRHKKSSIKQRLRTDLGRSLHK